jgi:membrane peptidoglycan carboxypeptidase
MQLAKNLWLSRTRTIGRKLQEAILTVALESSLSKDKILELYLNVVEYGPNLYGIGPASKEILHKEPLELTLTDAMYLVLRLPAPNRSASYEQMRGLIGKLLDNAMRAGKVTPDMVEIEKGQFPILVNLDDD